MTRAAAKGPRGGVRRALGRRAALRFLECGHAGSPAMKYVYCFAVWPDETWGFERAVCDLFAHLEWRVEMEFTEEEFERFRSGLSHAGLSLREIERWPQQEPETVL